MRRLLVLTVVACSGCAIPLKGLMRPATGPLSLESTATTARVIFARPARLFGSAIVPTFVDPQRKLVFGQTVDDSYFAVDLEPGVYQVCPAFLSFSSLVNRQPTMISHDWFELGARAMITELEVAAGNTYLLEVTMAWGPRVTVLPVIPGSAQEEALLAALPKVRAAEVEPSSAEYQEALEPETLELIYELCRDSSGHPDTYTRMLPGESRPSVKQPAPGDPAPPPL